MILELTLRLSENGFIRIAGHPNYPNRPGAVPAVFSIPRQISTVTLIQAIGKRHLTLPKPGHRISFLFFSTIFDL